MFVENICHLNKEQIVITMRGKVLIITLKFTLYIVWFCNFIL